MSVGSGTVVDKVNTTEGLAEGVIALGGIGGLSVVDEGVVPAPLYIATEDGDLLITEAGDYLVTQR